MRIDLDADEIDDIIWLVQSTLSECTNSVEGEDKVYRSILTKLEEQRYVKFPNN